MKKINLKSLIINICCFFILAYPFNYTISAIIYPNNIIKLGSVVLPICILFFMNSNKKINKYQLRIFIFLMLFSLFVYTNNYYFVEERYLTYILYIIYLTIIFILSYNNEDIIESIKKVLEFFILEHIIATFFVQIFHDYYVSNIMPWLTSNGDEVAKSTLNSLAKLGYNCGITTHYSTNGIYLAIATLFFFSQYLDKHKKGNIILTILSLIALMLTAKRAHLLFSIMGCLMIYIINNNLKKSEKIIKLLTTIIVIIIIISITSAFVPQLLNVIERFSARDLLNGRTIYYEICKEKWNNHLLLGNGWGYFSYYYHTHLYGHSIYGYEYIDAHNVYYQLLCEVGIIGFIFITGCMIYVFIISKKLSSMKLGYIYSFCFGYQVFFLLYCLTGNPLYDLQCYSIYFIVIGIVLGKSIELKERLNRN